MSDQDLIQSMEIFEEDQQLVDALEAAETERFVANAEEFYQARENQREYQRNLSSNRVGKSTRINPVVSCLSCSQLARTKTDDMVFRSVGIRPI